MAALVMLPFLLLTGVVQAGVLYRCNMDGQARKACCCPEQKAEERDTDPPAGPTISRTACCDTERQARVDQAPAVRSSEESLALAAAVVPVETLLAIVLPPPAPGLVPAIAQAAPPPRPSLILQKSSRLL